MPQSLAQIYLHIVFSTKNRQPFLQRTDLREQMHMYLGGICRDMQQQSIIVGGVEDHVHILCRFGRQHSVADFVRDLKRESSKWIEQKGPALSSFAWQAGDGVFSVSPSHVEALKQYIASQEQHHRRESFQDEFRRLLKKYGIKYDEQCVWD